jgi:hypothetical protein
VAGAQWALIAAAVGAADGIVKLFTLFGGCEDWLLWRLR